MEPYPQQSLDMIIKMKEGTLEIEEAPFEEDLAFKALNEDQ